MTPAMFFKLKSHLPEQNDMDYFHETLFFTYPWYQDLTMDRQCVLIDMCHMGWKKFQEFKKMIEALSIHDYHQAAFEMLDSDWARQVQLRANALAHGMITGVYEI